MIGCKVIKLSGNTPSLVYICLEFFVCSFVDIYISAGSNTSCPSRLGKLPYEPVTGVRMFTVSCNPEMVFTELRGIKIALAKKIVCIYDRSMVI